MIWNNEVPLLTSLYPSVLLSVFHYYKLCSLHPYILLSLSISFIILSLDISFTLLLSLYIYVYIFLILFLPFSSSTLTFFLFYSYLFLILSSTLSQVEKGRQHGLFAPGFVVKMAIRMIRTSVLKTADFDIRLLSPIEHADRWDASLTRF